MKFIENTVDTENLGTYISHEDLEENMVSCDTVKMNGQNQMKENSIEKLVNEKLTDNSKLTNGNGIHRKVDDQSKCNGNMMNGFCDEVSDDEFQLVLESSSDDGGSPLKKIDEDTISAPQIVQEIEDLLGINASSVGIDEEIEKELNGTESIELNDKYDDSSMNSESANTPQEIKDVFEDQVEDKTTHNSSVEGKNDVGKNETSKPSGEATECDSSSNMNLVFDEIEIGTHDSVDSQDEETIPIEKLTERPEDPSKISNIDAPQSNKTDSETVEMEKFTEIPKQISKTPDIDESQSNEAESTVKSSVEDTKYKNQEMNEGNEKNKEMDIAADEVMYIEVKEQIDSNKLGMTKENNPSTNITNLVEKSADCQHLVEMLHDEVKSENEESQLPASSCNDILDSKSKPCDEKSIQDIDSDSKSQSETSTAVSSFSSSSEGEIVRKRTSSVDEAKSELKRPKLQNGAEENKSQIFKRRSSDPLEIEVKRPKLSDSVLVTETLVDSSEEETVTGNSLVTEDDVKDEYSDGESTKESKTEVEGENNDKICDKVAKNNLDEDSVISTTQTTGQSELKTDCKLTTKNMQSGKIDSSPAISVISSNDISELPLEKPLSSLNEVSTSGKDLNEPHSIKSLTCVEVGPETKSLEAKEKITGKNKENIEVSSSSNSINSSDEVCVPSTNDSKRFNESKNKSSLNAVNKSKSTSNTASSSNVVEKADKIVKVNSRVVQEKKDDKLKQVNRAPSSSKETEKLIKKSEQSKTVTSKSPFELLTKNIQQAKPLSKKVSNLDLTTESVVDKVKSNAGRVLPLLKKFHKDQLKKLTRSDLEELVVMKICEAVTDRSEIGQMRLRCQTLEQNNELWRKKAAQFEKQNRELEMVLKRFLAETAQNKRENQDRVVVPIKVTRSVGLQVVLASSMHGALIASKNKLNSSLQNEPMPSTSTSSTQSSAGRSVPQHQPQLARPKPVEREQVRATTFTPPVQPVSNPRPRGRPARATQSQPSSPQPSPPKVSPPSTPVKFIAPKTTMPSKDLEVIDLTDKEEKTKAPPQTPVGGSIRVAPATQMCFVQQSPTNSPPQQMAYFVQKPGQRPQQYLVTTSSASPSKASGTVTQRPAPALAVPVFRSGQIIPVQTGPQAVRAVNNAVSPATRQLPQAMRLPSQMVSKHPAPLPSAPAMHSKPGFKGPPPKPQLKIAKTVNGIMLSWSMLLSKDTAEMASYQLYAYQEGHQAPTTNLWKKVGDVKALPLPMACTLTQFIDGHRYHFAVRAVDVHGRIGPFSPPSTIMLTK